MSDVKNVAVLYHRMMAHVINPPNGEDVSQNKLEKFWETGRKLDELATKLDRNKLSLIMNEGWLAYLAEKEKIC